MYWVGYENKCYEYRQKCICQQVTENTATFTKWYVVTMNYKIKKLGTSKPIQCKMCL